MNSRNLTIIGIIIIVIIAIFALNNSQEQKKSGLEKAADDISDGVKNAGSEFKDKGPVEKAGDAVKDAGQNLKDAATKN